MECTKFKRIVLSGLLSGSIMLSVGITANASDFNDICYSTQLNTEILQKSMKVDYNISNHNFHNPEESLGYILDALVKEGSLKKDRAEEIKKYIEKNVENKIKANDSKGKEKNRKHFKKPNIIGKMVKENVITKEEAKLIIEKAEKLREEKLSKALNSLVEREVITENKATEVKNYLKAAKEERRKEFDKIKGMSKDERKTYFKNSKKEGKSIFSKMVEEGIITEAQSKELKKALKNNK